ncbi:MAG: hypothetical protein D6705_14360 [Deltaproteobacteria bacterium]|nr:MAG: hypothetical protein D6705_14360 [Deltaproteobacteria bacterium]
MDGARSAPRPTADDARRRVLVLARSLYREIRAQGFSDQEVIGLSSALLEFVRADIRPPRDN